MRKFICANYFGVFLAAMFTLTLLQGCDEPQPAPAESIIRLTPSTVYVEAVGGEVKVDYYIENQQEELAIEYACEASWIGDISISPADVSFVVEANEGDAREATISLTYGTVEAQITVRQAEYEPAGAFGIVVEELNSTSCITSVEPRDSEMMYIMYMSEVSYFIDCEIATAEALFEDDKSAFVRGAAYEGISLEEYLHNCNTVFSGVTRSEWSSMRPGVSAVLYAYGIEFNDDGSDYEVVSDIAYEIITPPRAELHAEVAFELLPLVEGPTLSLKVTPEAWEGHYAVDILDTTSPYYITSDEQVDSVFEELIATAWFDNCNYLKAYFGYDDESLLGDYCYTGVQDLSFELNASTSYCALVYAVDMVGGALQVVSSPAVCSFTTEGVEPSSMTINIEVENAYTRIADLKLTPSIDTENYKFMIVPSAYITASYDEEILNILVTDYLSYAYTARGESSHHITTLSPDTDYSVYAFGYYGGVVTTPLFRADFTTEPAERGTVAVDEVLIGGPYNPGDLARALPDEYGDFAEYDGLCYLVTMQTITDSPTDYKYFNLWEYDLYSFYAEYDPDAVLNDLIYYQCPPVGVEFCGFDTQYVVTGAAMDYRGNVADVWVSPTFNHTADDFVSVDPLVELLRSNDMSTTAQRSSVVYGTTKQHNHFSNNAKPNFR